MKKIATAAALIAALTIPGLALASAPKVGDKLNLCGKAGAYTTILQGGAKCDGTKVPGKLTAIKNGKLEVDVKGKKLMIDQPKAMDSKAAPAAVKADVAKAGQGKATMPTSAMKGEPMKAPETKAMPDKTMTPATPDKK